MLLTWAPRYLEFAADFTFYAITNVAFVSSADQMVFEPLVYSPFTLSGASDVEEIGLTL